MRSAMADVLAGEDFDDLINTFIIYNYIYSQWIGQK